MKKGKKTRKSLDLTTAGALALGLTASAHAGTLDQTTDPDDSPLVEVEYAQLRQVQESGDKAKSLSVKSTTLAPDLTRTLVAEHFKKLWGGKPSIDGNTCDQSITMIGGDDRVRARGLQACREVAEEYAKAFPDLKIAIDEILVDGDRAVIRWTARGTHKGSLKGVAPTDKTVEFKGMQWYTLRNGKIVKEKYVYDSLDLYEQLGAARIVGR